MLLGQLGNCCFIPQRFQGYPGFKVSCNCFFIMVTPISSSLWGYFYILATGPNLGVQYKAIGGGVGMSQY